MNTPLARLRVLAGILLEDVPHILSQDEADDLDAADDDARYDAEQKAKAIITQAFSRVGLTVDYMIYDGNSREATVQLDDTTIDLDRLCNLQKSGLADRYSVSASGGGLEVLFTLANALDHAVG